MLVVAIKVLGSVSTSLSKSKLRCKLFARSSNSASNMKVLNVAEKNDAAKHIANFLSRGTARRREGLSVYNKIYEFTAYMGNQKCDMIMTSVSGHLLQFEFTGEHRKWHCCNPLSLFDAPVVKSCATENALKIKNTLEREIKKCQALIIWTDCDREGENIGYEIISVCRGANPRINIHRAKFSEITQTSVSRALQNLTTPDKAVNDAVDVRAELDLRTGAAFTRFQTIRLRKAFPRILADMLISYGSCQFPTLGFVVERFLAIENFVVEPYWRLEVRDVRNELTVQFRWERGRLFEKLPCEVFLDICREQPTAKVVKVTSKPKTKWRPLPLDTVELGKLGSRKLHLTAKETMRVAEKLYTQGFISYPRTETNIFPKELNLVPLVNQQADSTRWGDFANRLLQRGLTPRQGKKSDQAHPPIHPTKYTHSLNGNEGKVYELVVRHFLACLSSDAVGQETTVEIEIAGEKFHASGLRITEKNYLEVYIYDKWSDKEIHAYREGQQFDPTSIEMVEESTCPPKLLTEADLISLMDKHGIGTDATHAEHIDTIKAREYAGLVDGTHLMPGKLGIGLISGYDKMGLQMTKPNLRAELENDLKLICERRKSPHEVLQAQIAKYRAVFQKTVEKAKQLDETLATYLDEVPEEVPEVDPTTLPEHRTVFICPKCGSRMILKERRNNAGKYVGCMGFPTCNNVIWLPTLVQHAQVLDQECRHCPGFRKIKFQLTRSIYPLADTTYETCIGCDEEFNMYMGIRNDNIRGLSRSRDDSGFYTLTNVSVSANRPTRPSQPSSSAASASSANASSANASSASGSSGPRIGLLPKPGSSRGTSSQSTKTNANANKQTATQVPSTQNAQQPAWGTIDESTVILCMCQETALQLTVKKEGPNKGRVFYKCAKRDDAACSFFLWGSDKSDGNTSGASSQASAGSSRAGSSTASTSSWTGSSSSSASSWAGSSSQAGTSRAGPSSQTSGNRGASASLSADIACNCNRPAIQRTVQKDGPNKGRKFYTCPKGMSEERCNFFQWSDDANAGNDSSNARDKRTRAGSRGEQTQGFQKRARVQRKCGVCGVEGHTRRSCPENSMD